MRNETGFAVHRLSIPDGWAADEWAGMRRAAEALDWGGPIVPLYPDPPSSPVHMQKPGTIYFIGAEVGAIKIGFTSNLSTRLRRLSANSPVPLAVLASRDGVAWDERAYHLRFSRHRLHGEWFDRHPDILAEVDRLNASPLSGQGRGM